MAQQSSFFYATNRKEYNSQGTSIHLRLFTLAKKGIYLALTSSFYFNIHEFS